MRKLRLGDQSVYTWGSVNQNIWTHIARRTHKSDSLGLPLLGLKGPCLGKFPSRDGGPAPFRPCLGLSWEMKVALGQVTVPPCGHDGGCSFPSGERSFSLPGSGEQVASASPPTTPYCLEETTSPETRRKAAWGELGLRQPKTELESKSPGSATHCDLGKSLPFSRPQFPHLENGSISTGLRRPGRGRGSRGPRTHRGVGPPAHAAAVGLGMLDGMGREVDLQGGGVRVGPVAVGTLVGLVLVVLALVRLWGAQQGSGAGWTPPAPPPPYAPLGRRGCAPGGGRRALTWRLES